MKSKIAQQIRDNTPSYIGRYVQIYSDIIHKIDELVEEKNIDEEHISSKLDVNFYGGLDLKGIAQLEEILGDKIIQVDTSRKKGDKSNYEKAKEWFQQEILNKVSIHQK